MVVIFLVVGCCSWVDRHWDDWFSGNGKRIESRSSGSVEPPDRPSRGIDPAWLRPLVRVRRGLANPILVAALARFVGGEPIGRAQDPARLGRVHDPVRGDVDDSRLHARRDRAQRLASLQSARTHPRVLERAWLPRHASPGEVHDGQDDNHDDDDPKPSRHRILSLGPCRLYDESACIRNVFDFSRRTLSAASPPSSQAESGGFEALSPALSRRKALHGAFSLLQEPPETPPEATLAPSPGHRTSTARPVGRLDLRDPRRDEDELWRVSGVETSRRAPARRGEAVGMAGAARDSLAGSSGDTAGGWASSRRRVSHALGYEGQSRQRADVPAAVVGAAYEDVERRIVRFFEQPLLEPR